VSNGRRAASRTGRRGPPKPVQNVRLAESGQLAVGYAPNARASGIAGSLTGTTIWATSSRLAATKLGRRAMGLADGLDRAGAGRWNVRLSSCRGTS
jgi:hypothetical protein